MTASDRVSASVEEKLLRCILQIDDTEICERVRHRCVTVDADEISVIEFLPTMIRATQPTSLRWSSYTALPLASLSGTGCTVML